MTAIDTAPRQIAERTLRLGLAYRQHLGRPADVQPVPR